VNRLDVDAKGASSFIDGGGLFDGDGLAQSNWEWK
jgi:hypothetical protein